jgi:hypothetical protein
MRLREAGVSALIRRILLSMIAGAGVVQAYFHAHTLSASGPRAPAAGAAPVGLGMRLSRRVVEPSILSCTSKWHLQTYACERPWGCRNTSNSMRDRLGGGRGRCVGVCQHADCCVASPILPSSHCTAAQSTNHFSIQHRVPIAAGVSALVLQ